MHRRLSSGESFPRRLGVSLALGLALLATLVAFGGALHPIASGAATGTPSGVFPPVTAGGSVAASSTSATASSSPSLVAEASATSAEARGTPVRGSYLQAGATAVQYTFPATNDIEVDSSALVYVQFTKPVALLTALEQQVPRPVLAFSPPVTGSGKWLTSALYTFKPDPGLAPDTTYNVTVQQNLSDLPGGTLPQPFSWLFSTVKPAVSDVSPRDNTKFVDPATAVQVLFNQPMDRTSAQAALSLTLGGLPVAGSISWTDDQTLVFQPTAPLPRGATINGGVAAGARGAGSNGGGTVKAFAFTFSVSPLPKVSSTDPADGSQAANSYGASITFTAPMDRAKTEAAVTIDPAPDQDHVPTFFWSGDTTLRINYGFQPSSSYRISVGAGATDRYGTPIVAPYSFSFKTQAPPKPDPFIKILAGSQGTFSAYLPASFYIASLNAAEADFTLYSLQPGEFRDNTYSGYPGFDRTPPSTAVLRTFIVPITNGQQDAEVQNQVTVGDALPSGGTLAPGYYLLDVTRPGGSREDRVSFEVTRAGLVVKRGADDALVWAADLKDGSPIAGAPVAILSGDGTVLAQGTTDADGTAHLSIPHPEEVRNSYSIFAQLSLPDQTVLATQQWTGGVNLYGLNIPVSYYPQVAQRSYAYTDRPIYRAGETVHLRMVSRTDDDGSYSVPQNLGDVAVQVSDSRGRNVGAQSLKLDGFGSLGADIQIPDDGATGNYSVSFRTANTFIGSTSFLVAEFRVPEFAVKLDTDRPAYVNGSTIGATVQADFFFGAHLPDAALAYQVNASPYSFYPTDRQYSRYSFNDFDFAQQQKDPKSPVATGTGQTDQQGSATFNVPGSLGDYPNSERFSITATITDQNRQQISASKEVIVHHAAYYAGVLTQKYLTAAGDPVDISVVTVDTTGVAAPGVSVVATAYLRTWDNKTQRQPDGSVRYVSTVIDTLVDTRSLTTGGDGKATYSFTPVKGGEYRIVIRGQDSSGNTFQSSTYTYVTSRDFVSWQVQNDNLIKLIADKTEYVPGEVAHVLVPAPFAGAIGLVTMERGRILSSRVQAFPTNSTIVDVPITDDMAPTVYLSVSLLEPGGASGVPDFRSGWAKLTVSPAAHTLNVSLTPDRTKAGPGETITVSVQTTDNSGNPAPAEVSVALVDEAVLSLADDRTRAIFPSFWSERPLGVASGSSLNISVNSENSSRQAAAQRTAARKAAAFPSRPTAAPTAAPPAPPPPAPALAAAGGAAPAVSVRSDFQNTAYWKADVTTDASGHATVSIKLPDNLTTWRLAAKGVTVDTSAGEGQATLLTQRDIVVRPVAPRFFTAGDQTHLEALVTNRTDAALDVDVTLQAENLTVSGATQRITVPPGASTGAGWDTVAVDGPPVKLTFTAIAVGGPGDAVQVTLPVNPRSTPETVASSGIVTGDRVEEHVQIPSFAAQDKGSIDLAINASLVGVLHQATLVLETWRYEPADVTAGRLLSRVGEWQAAVTLNQSLDVQTAHSATVVAAIQRLSNVQSGSGAWCWWLPCNYPSPDITARALYALGVAREAGFAVDPGVLSRGARYLGGQYDKPSDVAYQPDPNTRAFWLLAASQATNGSRVRDDALAQQRDRLTGSGRASLLSALLLDGAASDDPEVRALAGDIASSGVLSAAGSHWEDQDERHPGYANSTQATSLVLLAMLRLDPTQPLLDGAMRWLTGTRIDGYWRSTRDTSIAISAISAFVAARETPVQGTAYSVDVNGIHIAGGTFNDADPGATVAVSTPLTGLPTDTALPVDIDKQGGGQLYYSLYLHYFAPTDEVSALSNGITVSHEVLPENGDDAVSTVKAGDLVRVRVTVAAPTDLQFIQVDDYLPAGLEAVDSSLKTTDPNLVRRQQQDLRNLQLPANQPGGAVSPFFRRYFYYYNPFDHVEIRDDRVSLFATSLSRGVHEYIYYARATTPGTFMQPPVVAVETDFPDIFARSDSNILTVTP